MIPGKAFEVTHTEEEWRRILTPEQYRIMRAHGTEVPGSCALNHEKRPGAFVCAGCGQRLFASSKKFNSGTGWPSFNDPIEGAVDTSEDKSYGMARTKVRCSRCGSHLGHVFPDGPNASALLYQPWSGDRRDADFAVITSRPASISCPYLSR